MNRLSVVPFLVACLGVASFTLMDAEMKDLSLAIGVYNAMLWRMHAGVLIGGAIFFGMRSRWPSLAVIKLHMLRSAVATCVALAFFWGIVRVPLAEGIAITFVAPLIALYLAAIWLGEEVGRSAVLASVLGIAGVAVIVAGKFQLGYSREAVVGLGSLFGSAVLYAGNLVLQRKLAQVATPIEVGFFQNVFSLPLLALASPWLGVVPSVEEVPAIVRVAAISLLSVVLLSWAYARAEAQVLLPVEYTAFIWAAILGWIWWGESITVWTLAGTVLIVTGCVLANYRRRPREEHVEASSV
jgi:S-adenosylmethionine uptake transporter